MYIYVHIYYIILCYIYILHTIYYTLGIYASWKSWKFPGIFFCLRISPEIYYFQSFVLEMSLNFLYSSTLFSPSLFLYFAFSNFVLYFLSLCILTTSHIIISFFLIQKIFNMSKCNCTFNDDWLIEIWVGWKRLQSTNCILWTMSPYIWYF